MRLLFGLLVAGCTSPGTGIDCDSGRQAGLPDRLAPFRLVELDPERSEMATGHVLLTQTDDRATSFVSVIDGCGDHQWWVENEGDDDKHMRARVSRDGAAVLVGARHKDTRIDVGEIRRVDIDSGAIERTRALDHHHDFVELPDGTIGYLSRERVDDVWFGGEYPLVADVVRTSAPGSTRPDAHGQVIHLLDDLEIEPWFTCSHMRETQFLKENLDWSHTNSLVHDPLTGDWTLGVRHWDTVLRLDSSGTVRWSLGGSMASLTPEAGTTAPKHAHFSEAWDDGLLVFDNRNHDVPPVISRLVEYEIDASAGTFRETWSYTHPEERFYSARGDVRRLPGGNLLVAWTRDGQVWELTREGEVVWAVDTDHKVVRIEYVPEWPPR